MKKRYKGKFFIVFLIGSILINLPACAQNATSEADINELQNQIATLTEELDQVKSQNEELKKENDSLKEQIEEKKQETIVQESDVTVNLTGKSTSSDKYGRMYVDFKFSVTNNTEKSIKGVQGIATFKDIFDVEIIPIQCDFTGQTIEPGATITINDLQLDCNRFMDDHMKLYNTDFNDIHFEYKITTIVFSDGTSKTI